MNYGYMVVCNKTKLMHLWFGSGVVLSSIFGCVEFKFRQCINIDILDLSGGHQSIMNF